MSGKKVDHRFIRSSNFALLVVAGLTLAMALASEAFAPFSARAFLFYGALVIYAVVGCVANQWILGRAPVWAEWLYFFLQLAFYGAMIRLGLPHYAIWLLTMPVVSQAAFRLPWPAVVILALGFLGLNCMLPRLPDWRVDDRWRTALSLSSAYVFVAVMTMVVESARQARSRAETLAEELAEANAQLHGAAAQAAALAAAHERNRIARDIHDGLGHYLTVVTVQLQAAHALLPAQPERAAAAVDKAERAARTALDDVRRSVGALRESGPRPSLTDALAGLVRESGLDASLECVGAARCLPEAVEQALFRCVQEALTNIRKHAGTVQAQVRLDYVAGTRVAVEISDRGRGRVGAVPSGGFGLTGLRERLVELGGSFAADNRPGGGFLVRAEVPA